MGSKSSNVVQTFTTVDESVIQGLAGVRGDGNTTQVLDGEAIKEAFTFGTAANAGQLQTIGQVLGTIDNLAGKVISAANDNSTSAIKAMQSGLSTTSGSIQSAYAQAANSGIDPQKALLGLGALAALAFIFKG